MWRWILLLHWLFAQKWNFNRWCHYSKQWLLQFRIKPCVTREIHDHFSIFCLISKPAEDLTIQASKLCLCGNFNSSLPPAIFLCSNALPFFPSFPVGLMVNPSFPVGLIDTLKYWMLFSMQIDRQATHNSILCWMCLNTKLFIKSESPSWSFKVELKTYYKFKVTLNTAS